MNRGLSVEVEIAGGAGPIKLRDCVTRYEIRAGLSELFEVCLELSLKDPDFDVRDAVGHAATLRFEREQYLPRMDGIVSRLRQLSALTEGVSRYELTVVPALWLTTRRRDHRIFQDMSVIEVASAVLELYGGRIPALDNLAGPHPPREYCVQYGETDFDFVSRILADEGISFLFDHHQRLSWEQPPAGDTTLVVTDDTRAALSVDRPVPYVPPAGALDARGPHVLSVLASTGIETSVTTLRDYDFERPAFPFESRADLRGESFQGEANLESYTYDVGQFTSNDDRERAIQVLEEARRPRDVYLLGASFALAPGTRLSLVGHPSQHVGGDLLVIASRTRVTVDAEGEALVSHEHEATPAANRFRPPRRPKPRIHGTQTAFVVGKKANVDEIDVDKYGRVKVRFTWDRRATSAEGKPTRFIRVSQGWAGQGYGMVLLPRVGDELIVSYLDGDPDEPLAVGRVHNSVYTSPLKLPDTDDTTVSIWKSRSSPADKSSNEDRFNMVRMQDKAGAEMLEFRAQRDFLHETLHDARENVGGNQTVQVKGGQSTSAGSISMSSGSTLTASAKTDMTLTAGGTLKAEAMTVKIRGKGVTSVRGEGSLFLFGGEEVSISSNTEVHIDAPSVKITSGHVTITGDTSVDVTGGVINLNS